MLTLLSYNFIWEWFGTLFPKPTQFDAVEVKEEENGQVVERPDMLCQPRALRWLGVKQNKNKKLRKVIDIVKNFNFRPYLLKYNFMLTLEEV